MMALAAVAAAAHALPAQQDLPAQKVRVAEAVRSDLTRLSDLERAYFAVNRRYTTDIRALHFTPASGAAIAVNYASARTFSASASHVRLAPFICFVIVASAEAGSPSEKPFCTDSRYGTAASELASAGAEPDSAPARASRGAASPLATGDPAPAGPGGRSPQREAPPSGAPVSPATLTTEEFTERLEAAGASKGDSEVVVVQFAVRDARYDPSRGVLEVAVDRVPLPLKPTRAPGESAERPALACYTRPAFVCGSSGLTYIARDLLRVPSQRAPDVGLLHSGLTLLARFAIGRRDDTPEPSLTLLALVLQGRGEVVSHWEPPAAH